MEPMEDLAEGVGESVSPPRGFPSFNNYDVRDDVYNRLVESGHPLALTQPDFRDNLVAHFNRLPASYGLDVNLDRVEEVLLHQDLLERATDPVNRPVYHIRFVENVSKAGTDDDDDDDDDEDEQGATSASTSKLSRDEIKEGSARRDDRLGDLNLDVKKNTQDVDKRDQLERFPKRQNLSRILTHEVIFSSIDKPKLLSQLSALLSDIGLNIREAHVFSTTDGYSLDVFVVDGWPVEETDGLYEAMEKAIAKSEGSWSKSSHSYSGGKMTLAQEKLGSWEIDWRLLNIGERIGSGSCGNLHRGFYHGEDVAVKVLRSENLNDALKNEFAQELSILREVHHRNVVRFIGACTKSPHLCIVTEYMPGGSLYDYLHKSSNALEFPELLKFAIHVSKGMEYLHHNDIIHRDLKTANLLMDGEKVVKVADFGVARFQTQGGVMTAETGTYRWMAPEVINHQPYDQRADVFSFAIVLWELITAKVPYDTMTPLQAALGVRQGLRPEIPANTNPKLLAIMQRCWDTVPSNRPTFSEVAIELETLLQEVVDNSEAADGGSQL